MTSKLNQKSKLDNQYHLKYKDNGTQKRAINKVTTKPSTI